MWWITAIESSEEKKKMNENIEKYGTDDVWDVEQYQEAEVIFEEFKDRKVETIDDVDEIVSDIMMEHGPDDWGGSQIIALILWRLFKKWNSR